MAYTYIIIIYGVRDFIDAKNMTRRTKHTPRT